MADYPKPAAEIRIRQIKADRAASRKSGYEYSESEIMNMNNRIDRLKSGQPEYEE